MADPYEDRYRREEYRGERGRGREDRGFIERTGDEVRSWFGDEEAERRRQMDERERERERQREQQFGRDYGPSYDYGRGSERGWGAPYRGEQGRGGMTGYRVEADYGTRYGGGYTGTYGAAEGYTRPGSRYGLGRETEGRQGFAGRGPKGYQRSDARINEDVCDRLTDAPDIDASNIEVRINNGEVTLAGSVRDRSEKRRAEDLIENISGVREVHNNLRVAREGMAGTGAADTSTATGQGTATRR